MGIKVNRLTLSTAGKLKFGFNNFVKFDFLVPEGNIGSAFDSTNVDIKLQTNAASTDVVNYKIVQGNLPAGLTLTSTTGRIVGQLNPVIDPTTYFFTVEASRGLEKATRQFNFTVNPNHAPVWITSSLPASFDRSDYSYQLKASDANHQVLTYSLAGGSLPKGLSLSSTGLISGHIAEVVKGDSYSFIVKASDGFKSTNKELSLLVQKNAPPTWPSNTIPDVLGGGYYLYQLNAHEPNGQALTYSAVELPENFYITEKGALYGVAPVTTDADIELSITVQASDGTFTVPNTFTLYVRKNTAPVFNSNPTIEVISSYDVDAHLTAIDPLGLSKINYEVVGTLPSWLNFDVETARLTGTAIDVMDVTTQQVTIRASNGQVTTDQIFDIKITPDYEPIWETEAGEVVRQFSGMKFTNQLSAYDPNGKPVTYTLISGNLPAGISVRPDGLITGEMPKIDNDTTFSIIVRASDGKKMVDRSFDLVCMKNLPPVWLTPSFMGQGVAGETLTFPFEVYDPEGLDIKFEGRGSEVVSFSPTNKTITFRLSDVARDTLLGISISASDGVNGVSRTFQVLNKFNKMPQWQTSETLPFAVSGFDYSVRLVADNPGNFGMTYELVDGTLPQGLAFSNGLIKGTPVDVVEDVTHTFTIRATNEIGFVDRTFTVVHQYNRAPEWITPEGQLVETLGNQSLAVELKASDFNGNMVSYSPVSDLPEGISLSKGVIVGRLPVTVEDVTHNITIRATDGLLYSDRTFTIRQLGNQTPIWTVPSALPNGVEGSNINIQLSVDDPENSPLTFSLLSGELPEGVTLVGDRLTGTLPEVVGDQTFTFTFQVSDGLAVAERTFTLNVVKNLPPMWETPEGLLGEILSGEGGYTFTLQASDPNGTALTYSLLSGTLPTGLSMEKNVLQTREKAKIAVHAEDQIYNFTVSVTDGKHTEVRDFAIKVLKNLPPVWETPEGDLGTFNEGETIDITFQSLDPESRVVEYSIEGRVPSGLEIKDSVSGRLTGRLGSVTQDTTYNFQILASDRAHSVARNFTMTVKRSTAPTWITPSNLPRMQEGSPMSVQLQTEAGGHQVLYSVVGTLPSGLTLSSSGLLSGTVPLVDVTQTLTFTIRATSEFGSSERTFSMQVVNNTPPAWSTPEGMIISGLEGEEVSFQLTATDADHDNISFQITSGVLPDTLIFDPETGVISGTLPAVDTTTNYYFTVGVFDGSVLVERNFFIKSQALLTFETMSIDTPDKQNSAFIDTNDDAAPSAWFDYSGNKDRVAIVPDHIKSATYTYEREFQDNTFYSEPKVNQTNTTEHANEADGSWYVA